MFENIYQTEREINIYFVISLFCTFDSGLSVIGEDIEDLRQLLNQSYNANDFYIKTMVSFTLTVLDELAIRNHIGSVPKILNEIWQVLGESGIALRKSILWLIETIKTTYKNTVDTLNRIFHGEAMSYVSSVVEIAIYKYDRFMKDLHLSFIKYVQNIWNSVSDTVMNNWYGMLERIQPMVMQFLHHSESMLWNISQEIFESNLSNHHISIQFQSSCGILIQFIVIFKKMIQLQI